MRLSTIAAIALLAPVAAAGQAIAPAGSTPAQDQMVADWARYATACRGGAVDGTQETAWGYCGTAEYLLYQLDTQGICLDTSKASYFSTCAPGALTDPLEGYPF